MAVQHPIPTNPRFKSLLGLPPFGKWTVLSYAGKRGPTHYWLCRCACGAGKVVAGESLKRGLSTCCRRCAHRVPMRPVVKHGQCNSITYRSWHSMIQRCHNPNDSRFHDYGGRGIAVCGRWRNSFAAFLEDMGVRPSLNLSIERKDNARGYEPDNCRWATRTEQQNNSRRNHLLTHEGITLSRTEWARRRGLSVETVRVRLRLGWTVAEALDTPPNSRFRNGRAGRGYSSNRTVPS